MNRMRLFMSTVGLSSILWAAGCQMPSDRQAHNPGALPELPTSGDKNLQLNATTLFAHGHLLERQGYFDRAIEQYQKAIERKPDFLSAHNRLGVTLNKAGRHTEASAAFRKAIDLDPSQPHLYNNLGFSCYLEGNYPEAQQALSHALEIQPEFARARMNMALVFAKLERFDDAYEELLAVSSESEAAYNMGMILADAQRFPEAAQYLEAALVARPDFQQARQQLRTVARMAAEQQRQGQPEGVEAPAFAGQPANVQTTSTPPSEMQNGNGMTANSSGSANDAASNGSQNANAASPPPSNAHGQMSPAPAANASSARPAQPAPSPAPAPSYTSPAPRASNPPAQSSFLNSMTLPAGIHQAPDIKAKYDKPAGVTPNVAPITAPSSLPPRPNPQPQPAQSSAQPAQARPVAHANPTPSPITANNNASGATSGARGQMTPVSGQSPMCNQTASNQPVNNQPPVNAQTTSRPPQPVNPSAQTGGQPSAMKPVGATPAPAPAAQPSRSTSADDIPRMTPLDSNRSTGRSGSLDEASNKAWSDLEAYVDEVRSDPVMDANCPGAQRLSAAPVTELCEQDVELIDDLIHGRIDWNTFISQFMGGQYR